MGLKVRALTCQGDHEALQLAHLFAKDKEAVDVVGEADGAAAERHQQVGHSQVHQDVVQRGPELLVPDGNNDDQAVHNRGGDHNDAHQHGHRQVHAPRGLVGPLGAIERPRGPVIWGVLRAVGGVHRVASGAPLLVQLRQVTVPKSKASL